MSDDEEEEQDRPNKKRRMDAEMKQFIRDQLKAVATKEQVEEIGSRMAKNEERIIENAESIVRTTETVGKLRDSIAKIEQEIISERRGAGEESGTCSGGCHEEGQTTTTGSEGC